MELDDFKNRKTKNNDEKSIENLNIDIVVDSLKKSEKSQKIKTFAMISFLVTLAVIYLSIQQRSTGNAQLGFALCGIGFLMGATYLYFRYRSLPAKFYNLNIEEVLKKSHKRLEYLKKSDYLIITPILMILGTGGGLILTDRLLRYTDKLALIIAIWVVFFTLLCIFGFFAGKKSWEKEHGKLYREIDELVKNFSNQDSF